MGLIGATADAGLFYAAVQLSGGRDAALGMSAFFLAALGAVLTVVSAGACLIAGMLELAGREAPAPHGSPHH